jgi:hypothetical protein
MDLIMRNRRRIWLSLFLFLSVFTHSIYADPPLPVPVGRAVWIQGGSLKAIMPNKEERLLQKMSIIYLYDTLITDNKTHAEIVFTDNTLMTFVPNTKFYIAEYKYNPKEKSAGKSVMDLITGGFRTITGIISQKNPDDYQINTPVATIGVRGTDYAVFVNSKNELYITRYKGTPCVKNLRGEKTELCLDKKVQYAEVPSAEQPPVPLSEQPAVFAEKIEITPFTLEQFLYPSGTPGAGGSNSFCLVPG